MLLLPHSHLAMRVPRWGFMSRVRQCGPLRAEGPDERPAELAHSADAEILCYEEVFLDGDCGRSVGDVEFSC